jgi:hypothetical protein
VSGTHPFASWKVPLAAFVANALRRVGPNFDARAGRWGKTSSGLVSLIGALARREQSLCQEACTEGEHVHSRHLLISRPSAYSPVENSEEQQ